MSQKKIHRYWPLCLLLPALLSGCAHVLSPGIERQARKDVDFTAVLQDPAKYTGSVVIWGGVIVATEVKSNGTDIVILETPLDYYLEPEERIFSRGRFIATTTGILDPAVYRPGLRITVGGEVAGRELRPLGKSQYPYPVLKMLESRLWSDEPYGYYPYYGPYYGPSVSIGLGWFWWGGGGHWDHHGGGRFGGGLRGGGRVR
jgi:outer membrane lipoprotein